MADIMVTLQKLANENTAKTFKFNKEEAATSRKWQEQMSATNHQREVKDLIAAGLNPVLSSGGSGASTPTTSSASGVADSAVNAIGNVQSSRTSAAAMRYSADRSLQAAQAAAAAQRYAADRNYQASVYASDKSYGAKMDTSPYGIVMQNLRGKGYKEGDLLWKAKVDLKDAIKKVDPASTNINKMSDARKLFASLDFTSKNKINKFFAANGILAIPQNYGRMIQFLFTGKGKFLDMMTLKRNANSARFFR